MSTKHRAVAATLMLACTVVWNPLASAQTSTAASSTYKPSVGQAGKDVVWVPTSQALVDRMLDMAKLTPQDRLVDLGSGDGRTVITAAKRGATARGIEYNPDMVAISRQAAKAEGVSKRATFEQADIFQSDFSDATVVTLFLLPSLNVRLRPTILEMKPGTRVVSNSFDMGEWEPDETAQISQGCSGHCVAYKWIVPAKVGGTWRVDGKELVLKQTFQKVEGTLHDGNGAVPIREGRLEGTRIAFQVGDKRFTGEVNGKAMQGKLTDGSYWNGTLVGQ